MLNDFTMELSTKIEFGKGKLVETGNTVKEFGAKKAVIITDKGLVKTNIIKTLTGSLENENIEFAVYDKVRENPRDYDAQVAGDFARKEKADVIIACGGGSSMDIAKAAAAMVTNHGDIKSIMKPNKVETYPAPLVCIPTTAGTGSEVTSFAVLTIEKENRKSSIFDEKIRPTVAINDPDVLKSVPPIIAAATGMDALTHAIEAYTCKLSTPITDGIALQAIRYISENIVQFVEERNDENCMHMMAGSLMAGIAFGCSDIAGVHCMAEAIGGMYDTPHGIANSIFLPIVFEYNMTGDLKKHSKVAEALGVDIHGKSDAEAAAMGAERLKDISRRLKLPTLSELEYINPEKFCELAKLCMKNVSMPSNVRNMNEKAFELLFEKAYSTR